MLVRSMMVFMTILMSSIVWANYSKASGASYCEENATSCNFDYPKSII